MSNGVLTSTAAAPHRLKVGYNLPWSFNHFGYDFGPDPYDLSRQEPCWKDTWPRNLRYLKRMGVRVVRWFILGNAWNYGLRPHRFYTTGRGTWYTFDPPSTPDSRFAKHFEQALRSLIEVQEMQLIPSLISFEAFFPST